jgi:hypothetical protein
MHSEKFPTVINTQTKIVVGLDTMKLDGKVMELRKGKGGHLNNLGGFQSAIFVLIIIQK